jgi:hypothetical protein
MNRRIRKKLHRRFLCDVVCDASQSSAWRRRLFDEPSATLEIGPRHSEGLPARLARAIRRHDLHYTVRVVDGAHAPGWREYADDGCVLFRFEAREFPEVHAFSANNPAVV